jgi:hypothetical protein
MLFKKHWKTAIFFAFLPSIVLAASPVETVHAVSRLQSPVRGESDLYSTETYAIERADGKVKKITVHYFGPDGVPIADLTSEFSDHPYLPNSDFNDLRNGFSYRVKLTDEVHIETRAKNDKDWTSVKLKLQTQPPMMTLPGVSLYIQDHIRDFASPQARQEIRFIVPSRGSDYGVTISTDKIEADGSQKFHVRLQNFMLRLVAPDIDLIVSSKTGQVLSFHGVSNIKDHSGKTAKVDTVYSYGEVSGGTAVAPGSH